MSGHLTSSEKMSKEKAMKITKCKKMPLSFIAFSSDVARILAMTHKDFLHGWKYFTLAFTKIGRKTRFLIRTAISEFPTMTSSTQGLWLLSVWFWWTSNQMEPRSVESYPLSKSANNQSWPRPFWVKDQKSIFLKGNLTNSFKDDLGQRPKQPRSG